MEVKLAVKSRAVRYIVKLIHLNLLSFLKISLLDALKGNWNLEKRLINQVPDSENKWTEYSISFTTATFKKYI